jgi:hypothetical protein
MSADKLKRYRFVEPDQWSSCLFAKVDPTSLRKGRGIGPLPSFALPGDLYKSEGGHAPAINRRRDILWLDKCGQLYRLTDGLQEPVSFAAPPALARAKRIVAAAGGLWVIGEPPDALQRYDDETYTRLLTVDVPDARVIDIARCGHDVIAVLVLRRRRVYVFRMDRGGRILGRPVELRGVRDPVEFVCLRRAQRYVVLAKGKRQHLLWFATKGGSPLATTAVAEVRPCFTADCLGSDSDERVFLAGADDKSFGAMPFVVIFDGDGDLLTELPLEPQDVPVKGIDASRNRLLVAGRQGLRVFSAAQRLPEGGGSVGCELMTPVLFSPDREDRRRWLRIEAQATLPAGSSLEISWIATDQDATRNHLEELACKKSIPAARRIDALLSDREVKRVRVAYHGSIEVDAPSEKFTAKLFDVDARYLWVHVALTAAAGAQLPRLTGLTHGEFALDLPTGGIAAGQLFEIACRRA